jgi:DNA-binding transcriptional ArsR family regulator
MRQAGENQERPAAAALRHPTRVRILEVVGERDLSPIQFVQLGLARDKTQGTLSHVSYHFRQLAIEGCLEVVDRIRRRGAVEHVYRACGRGFYSDEDWERLSPDERRRGSRVIYQGLAARAEGAMLSDTFDSRPDRHLTWVPMEVDERGWSEAMKALLECFWTIERVRGAAKERLEAADQRGTPVTIGILGFETSPVAARPFR